MNAKAKEAFLVWVAQNSLALSLLWKKHDGNDTAEEHAMKYYTGRLKHASVNVK